MEKIKLMQFGAPTCMPCVAIKEKILEWIEVQQAKGINIEYKYISVNLEPQMAAEAGVFTVPAIKLYIEGKVAVEDAGYFSLDGFEEKCERYLDILQQS